MKRFICIALLSCFYIPVRAQYFVIKVIGKVSDPQGQQISAGKPLKSLAGLKWTSASDKLFVIEPGKGEHIVSPEKKTEGAKSPDLLDAFQREFRIQSKSTSLSGRSLYIDKIPDALHPHPLSNGKIIIDKENKFLFDLQSYPQNTASTFFIQIEEAGKPPLIRPLKTIADTLILTQEDLMLPSSAAPAKYTLGYFNKAFNPNNRAVISFVPYFDRDREAAVMAQHIREAYRNFPISKEALRDSIYESLYHALGKPNGLFINSLDIP